jgi:hypothetical protein
MATLSPVCGAGGALFWKDFYVLGQNYGSGAELVI